MFSNIILATDLATQTNNTNSLIATGGILGALMAFLAAFMIVAIIAGIAIYVYASLATYTIAKKLGYKNAWLAWIPFANIAMILELGEFHWAWVFLILIPILGWLALGVLSYIAMWRIFEKRKYPGWLSLITIGCAIPYLCVLAFVGYMIVLGLVAWKDK